MVFYEALLRVQNDRTMRLHADLVKYAVRNRQVGSLDVTMVGMVLNQLAMTPGIHASVNISPVSFEMAFDRLYKIMSEHRSTGRLIVEILESEPIGDRRDLLTKIGRIRELGARIAIDDYGHGHTTREDVMAIRPDYLKIAGPVMIDAANGKYDQLHEATELAALINAEPVAEHIDTEEKAEIACNWGVNLQQGYLYAKPGPEIKVDEKYLEKIEDAFPHPPLLVVGA